MIGDRFELKEKKAFELKEKQQTSIEFWFWYALLLRIFKRTLYLTIHFECSSLKLGNELSSHCQLRKVIFPQKTNIKLPELLI